MIILNKDKKYLQYLSLTLSQNYLNMNNTFWFDCTTTQRVFIKTELSTWNIAVNTLKYYGIQKPKLAYYKSYTSISMVEVAKPPQITHLALFTFYKFMPIHPKNSGSVNQLSLYAVCIIIIDFITAWEFLKRMLQ